MTKNETTKPDPHRILLLDGATGSELERRGVDIDLPLWSTHALLTKENRKVLRDLHAEYIKAGADVITANTFRTNLRALKQAGLEKQDRILTRMAIEEARRAIEETHSDQSVRIAGSVATVEDCYRPDLVPPDNELTEEHRRHVENLCLAGVNLLLIETINSIREGLIALECAKQTGLPVYISFICRHDLHLLSGENLIEAIKSVQSLHPDGILINCVPVNVADNALLIFREHVSGPFGVYANIVGVSEWTPDRYAQRAMEWLDRGASIIGGCCGTTPAHIAAIHQQRILHHE